MGTESAAPVEIELKLRGDPEVLRQLWLAPQLRTHDGAPSKVKDLENIYYDTVALRLRKRGYPRPRRPGAFRDPAGPGLPGLTSGVSRHPLY
jgi:hypothetical protein